MKTIVISGINLFQGGTLSIYRDCLENIIKNKLNETNNIIAFVHKKELFSEYSDKVTFIELPKSRKNYLYRLWYEYVYFYFYSKINKIDIWLSLHDITPNVKAENQFVYCHNPMPFYKMPLSDIKVNYKEYLFSLFYKYLYGINIKKNSGIIVQQDWIRSEFENMYNVNNVIVAKPTIDNIVIPELKIDKKCVTFIYPSFPRSFKNFEVICEACKVLEEQCVKGFEVLLTLDGTENKYARNLYKKYSYLSNIGWIGIQKRVDLFFLYGKSSCLIFPSKLETWGLPISEFKITGKPIFLADLPYAHETIGNYNRVCFFSPTDSLKLADLMRREIANSNVYNSHYSRVMKDPFAEDWKQLLKKLGF